MRLGRFLSDPIGRIRPGRAVNDRSATDYADRILSDIERPRPLALRKCTPRAVVSSRKELTAEQRANVDAKERFAVRVAHVLGSDESIRDLATFFGVKRTTLHERMRLARTDLAPLQEWFAKLDDYAEFQRLADEFLRTA